MEKKQAPIVHYKQIAEEVGIVCGVMAVLLAFVGGVMAYSMPLISSIMMLAAPILAIAAIIGVVADVLARLVIAYMKSEAVRK